MCLVDDEPLVPMQTWCERYEFRKRTPVPTAPPKYVTDPKIVIVGGQRVLQPVDPLSRANPTSRSQVGN